MKNLKKISALILALILVLSLSATAFADNPQELGSDGVIGTKEQHLSDDKNKVIIVKELQIKNAQGTSIYLPAIKYGYSVAKADSTANDAAIIANTTVTDSDGTVGVVYNGVGTPTITSTVEFGPNITTGYVTAEGATTTVTQPVEAPAAGVTVYRPITVDFTNVTFPHAGVYRYKITETEDSTVTLAKAGVVHRDDANTDDADYNNVRYMDVYVRMLDEKDSNDAPYAANTQDADKDGIKDTPEIYGYTCFHTNTYINGTQDASNLSTVSKTGGYTGATGGDLYETYDLTVSKTVSGSFGEKNHKFPIEVTLSNTSAVVGTWIYTTTDGARAATSGLTQDGSTGNYYAALVGAQTVNTVAGATTINVELADNNSVVLHGIPTLASATVTAKDTNDTFDVYTASVTGAATGDQSTANKVYLNGTGNALDNTQLQKNEYAQTGTVQTGNQTIAFTNTLTEISPTGYVVRIAPYALMLAVGIVFFILMRRRREQAEEA